MKNKNHNKEFSRLVGVKESLKLKARRMKKESVWHGLTFFGLVGWSIAIPTLLGTFLGVWLDSKFPGPTSWTLTFLIAGLALGVWNAWYWIDKENRKINDNHKENQTS